jgi:branched-chain amino acid aminotransferase
VGSIDGQGIGDGEPGPVSSRLRERFARVVAGEDPDFLHWLVPVNEER